jgi:5-methylcytosine-specific restriction endonuclease McrA
VSAHKRLYWTNRWKLIRKAVKAERPLCALCEEVGRVTVGTVCDHVNGHPEGETEEQFFAGPFQMLCVTCHESVKKRMEHGSGPIGCDVNGYPVGWRESE